MKSHFQSTQDELALLQPAIPDAITAYEKLATTAGMSAAQVGTLHTVDNSPNRGGHYGLDGTGFVKGVQLLADNYANIIGANASGQVTGITNSVLKSVIGNEAVVFTSAGQAQKFEMAHSLYPARSRDYPNSNAMIHDVYRHSRSMSMIMSYSVRLHPDRYGASTSLGLRTPPRSPYPGVPGTTCDSLFESHVRGQALLLSLTTRHLLICV
jgi:hypothetical protein